MKNFEWSTNEKTLSSVASLLNQKCAYHVGPNELWIFCAASLLLPGYCIFMVFLNRKLYFASGKLIFELRRETLHTDKP